MSIWRLFSLFLNITIEAENRILPNGRNAYMVLNPADVVCHNENPVERYKVLKWKVRKKTAIFIKENALAAGVYS